MVPVSEDAKHFHEVFGRYQNLVVDHDFVNDFVKHVVVIYDSWARNTGEFLAGDQKRG